MCERVQDAHSSVWACTYVTPLTEVGGFVSGLRRPESSIQKKKDEVGVLLRFNDAIHHLVYPENATSRVCVIPAVCVRRTQNSGTQASAPPSAAELVCLLILAEGAQS